MKIKSVALIIPLLLACHTAGNAQPGAPPALVQQPVTKGQCATWVESSQNMLTSTACSAGGTGDVVGPGSSTTGNVTSFNGATGKLIQDSGIGIASLATLTGSQTLTNKTITAPNISAPVITSITGSTQCLHVNSSGAVTGTGSDCGAGGGGTPGGSNTQVQYNNTGAFGGITGATSNGTTLTLASPAFTGTVTGAGTIPNSVLVNSGMTFGGQSVALGASATVQGNGAKVQLSTGATTLNNCAKFDTNGNVIDAGIACNSGGGTVTSIAQGTGILLSTAPCVATCTISTTVNRNPQTGTTYATLSTDGSQVVTLNNASPVAVSLSQANTAGFTSGFGVEYANIGAGAVTVTATTSVFGNGLTTLGLVKGQYAFVGSDSTNYPITAVTLPVMANNTLLGNSSGTSNYPTAQPAGTGVITALGNTLSAAGGVTSTIASGTSALGTGAITSATCASVVTTAATNVATTDTVLASFNGDPTAVTGYVPSTSGMLTIISYPTSGNVNFKVCNNTAGSITPGAITLNWRVLR